MSGIASSRHPCLPKKSKTVRTQNGNDRRGNRDTIRVACQNRHQRHGGISNIGLNVPVRPSPRSVIRTVRKQSIRQRTQTLRLARM
jgi:hypothetical protein